MTEAAQPTNPSAGSDAQTPVDSPVKACPANCPRCEAKITTAQMKEVFPSASEDKINGVTNAFNDNDAYLKFEIKTCLRKAHFFAQVRKEVGPAINALSEDLHYRPETLKKTFGYFKRNPAEAERYGKTASHGADVEAIGNRAYGGRKDLGNGNIASGDGYRFRGKGYLQLTGRSNYQAVQSKIDEKVPGSGVDIMNSDDQILQPKGGMLSAMAYWYINKLNAKADMGATGAHVDAITRVINKNTSAKSYEERRTNFLTITKKVFKVDECVNRGKTMQVPLGDARARAAAPRPRARPARR